jgi:hypothetical protein
MLHYFDFVGYKLILYQKTRQNTTYMCVYMVPTAVSVLVQATHIRFVIGGIIILDITNVNMKTQPKLTEQ